MSRKAIHVELSDAQRHTLQGVLSRPTTQARFTDRARMILWMAEGISNAEIARRLKTRPARVCKWRQRFASESLEGLWDDYRPGRPPKFDADELRGRILAQLEQKPPEGYARWNGPLLAQALGDASDDQIWRVLRKEGIRLERRRSWCVSTDPAFAEKAADLVGLYLNPPDNAVVVAVDEKPCIQALERAQGWLKLPNGKSLTGFAHEYKRHGTTTLFAALETATGRVFGQCKKRKRRTEFLDFVAELERLYPQQQLHIILDNLSTHKVVDPSFWKKHSNVHFHFTPTHASWLNQVEVWFFILSDQSLRGASFTSVKMLTEHIEAFIRAYNQQCAPFNWKKVRVEAKTMKAKYSDLCK